ncbi:hypothetical protein FACS1894152_8660 [Bacilli bacterium]|nr:hypothetical protein FACS1894152_8660 [Bacilli bacterium]
MNALENLVSVHSKGDPESSLLWTNKSLRSLGSELASKGYSASYRVVGAMLKMLGYSLQADKKTLTLVPSHQDRNAQFEYINGKCNDPLAAGSPILSIDAKKKENIRPGSKICFCKEFLGDLAVSTVGVRSCARGVRTTSVKP